MKRGVRISTLFGKSILMVLVFIIMITGIIGQPINLLGQTGIPTNNVAYASEEEEKEESEEGEEDEDEARGSSATNLMNVLDMEKSMEAHYMTNLESVLGYNEDVHHLVTLAALQSDTLKGGSQYSRIYSGGFEDESVETDISTNTHELYDKLELIKADSEELQKAEGINDSMVESIFGKSRGSLEKGEKDLLAKLEKITTNKEERDKASNAYEKKATKAIGEYMCRVSMLSTGYGGAMSPFTTNYKGDVTGSTEGFIHQAYSKYDLGLDGKASVSPTRSEAIKPCVDNLQKFKDAETPQMNGAITTLQNNLIKHDGKFNDQLALSLLNSNLRVSSGPKTFAEKYPLLHKKAESDGDGGFKNAVSSGVKFIGGSFSDYFGKVGGEFKGTRPISGETTFRTYGYKMNKKEYSIMGDKPFNKSQFEELLGGVNEVWGTNYNVGHFAFDPDDGFLNGTFDTEGDRVFKYPKAYNVLNKYLTINLLSSQYYTRDVDGFDEYKKEQFEEYITGLEKDPFILYKKHIEKGTVHDTVKNVKGLGWMPAYYDKKYGGELSEAKEKAMKDFDNTTVPGTGYFLMTESKDRAMKVSDLVAVEHDGDYSPLASWDGGKNHSRQSMGQHNKHLYSIGNYSPMTFKDGKVSLREDMGSKIAATYAKAFKEEGLVGASNKENGIGVDNYGNVMVGNDLALAIPYWHFIGTDDGTVYSTPLYKSTDERIKSSSYLDTTLSYNNMYEDKVNTAYASEEAIDTAIKEGDMKTLRNISSSIVDSTKETVKGHNKNFIESMTLANDEGTGELYITEASVTDSLTSDLESMYEEYTDADIIDRIAMVLKFGAWDMIRLTFVGFFVDFYNTIVYNFTTSQVFYATTIVDSSFFSQILPNLTLLIGALTMIYLAYSVYMLYMGKIGIKRIAFIVFGFTFLLIIPFLYSFIIEKGINDVSDSMLGTQTRQMMLVDSWTNDIKGEATSNSEASRLYGYGDTIEFRDPGQDYILTFHTTTSSINGCDIVNPDSQFCIDYATDSDTGEPLTDWKSSDLVSVNVSMYDVFAWLKSVEEEHRMTSDANVTLGINFETSGGTTGTLFDYLEKMPDSEEKGYEGLSDYNEYKIDTTSTYADIGQKGGAEVFKGETISGSDLLARIYYNANRNDDLVKAMDSLAYLYEEGIKNSDIKPDEKEFIIRDLSMTMNSRKAVNGGDTLSPVSSDVNDKYSLNLTVPGKGDNSHSGDMFNLYHSIQELNTFRPEGGYYGVLEGEVFDLNKKTINNYFTDFAVVRSSMDGGATNPSYKRAEAMVMSTVLWMNVNKEYDFELFPKNYDGSSVSLDNYMRVGFVPIGMFGNPADTSSDVISETGGTNNVGEYLSLRENMITLFFFSIMILMLLGYGFLKLVTLGGGLLAITMFGFIRTYLLGSEINKDNKFKTGALFTYGLFILMNIIFNAMWWLFGYSLNNSYAANDGAVGYPSTAVHSVIAAIVLGACIKVIIGIFKRIKRDPDSMGGNEYLKDVSNMKGKLQGMMSGTMKQRNNNRESVYSRDSKREGRNGLVPKDEIERSNRLGQSNLKNNLSAGGGMAASNIMNALDNSSKVNNAPNSLSNKYNDVISAKPKDRHLGNTLNKVDSIDTNNESILSKDEEKSLDNLGLHGSKVGTSGTGENVHVLGFGKSKEGQQQAQQLQQYLSKNGLKASLDNKGNVMFDAGKHNLATQSGRKVLLGGFMHNVADKIKDKDSATVTDVDNNSLLNNNFKYDMQSDGKVNVKVGGKEGLHHSVLADTLQTDWFKDKFTVSQSYSGKGKEGNIVLKPKESSIESIDESVSQLFIGDTRGRTREGYTARKDSANDKTLKFNGNSESSVGVIQDAIQKEGKKASGMSLHGNSLVFNGGNSEHRRIVKDIRQGLGESHTSDVKTAKMIATKVGNYVVNGDGNKQEPKLKIFNRKTQKEKDDTGNVSYNVNTAQTDISNMSDSPTKNNVSSLSDNKSMVNIDRKGKVAKDNVDVFKQMTPQEKQAVFSQQSNVSNEKPVSIRQNVGVQDSIKNTTMNNSLKGSGMSHSQVDVNSGNNKSLMRKVGIMGGGTTTTAYGGDNFGDKLNSFNNTVSVMNKHEKDFETLVQSKDNVLNSYNNHIGHFGSASRVKNQMEFIRTSNIDASSKSGVEEKYLDLTRNYNSGNLTTDSYNKELKGLNGNIEKLLKDKGMYDTSIITALNKKDSNGQSNGKGLSDKDKKDLEKYRKSKQKLSGKGVDKTILEKMDGSSFGKLKKFKSQGNKLKPNEDNKTFDINGSKELSNKETEELYNMIKDIS